MGYHARATISATKKIKLFSGPGTRKWPRFDATEIPYIKVISSNVGSRTKVVNISRGGALLQTRKKLRRGSEISFDIGLVGGSHQTTGLILRSSVNALKGIPQYFAAVAFDHPLCILGSVPEFAENDLGDSDLKPSPPDLIRVHTGYSRFQSIQYEVTAMIEGFLANSYFDPTDTGPDEMYRLNDW